MFNIRKLVIEVPTYDPGHPDEYDYRRAHKLILQEEDGLRVTMGEGRNAPDVVFERAVDRWRLFVRCDSGDEMCFIEFTDTQAIVTTARPDDEPLLVKERTVADG